MDKTLEWYRLEIEVEVAASAVNRQVDYVWTWHKLERDGDSDEISAGLAKALELIKVFDKAKAELEKFRAENYL